MYYREGETEGFIRPRRVEIRSATGAGDAFSAAVLDGFNKGMDVETTAKYGMATAEVALESPRAVNPDMDMDVVMQKMEE